MKWKIRGADPKTGNERDLEIEADTAEEAEQKAAYAGMLIESVAEFRPNVIDYKSPMSKPALQKLPEPRSAVRPMKWSSFFVMIAAVVGVMLAGIGASGMGPMYKPARFQSDVAFGATANSLERLEQVGELIRASVQVIAGLLIVLIDAVIWNTLARNHGKKALS